MKIWLNFIMKDEASVILRMLESVSPIIDGCVCVDTGSSDESKLIVKNFFESKGKPCQIYDHPFLNFSDARNFALEKLKCKDDYAFWIDCDEQIVIPSNFNINDFKNNILPKHELHTIMVRSGTSTFARRNFFSIKNNFRWVGAIHEILVCDDNITIGNIPDIITLVNLDGNSWSQGAEKKYLTHANILEAEVLKTNNPRDIFYLAQSYKDGGDYENAIRWYKERVIRTDGFYEERYYSQFMIGILYEILKKPYQETVIEYLKCSELDTLRAEHILNSIIILQREKLWQTALTLSTDAVKKYHGKNPYPSRLLFIDEGTYINKLMIVHNINVKALGKVEGLEQAYRYLCASVSDINEHLPIFKSYSEKYNNITEMGMRSGVSTHAFMFGKPKKLTSYDINKNPCVEKLMVYAKESDVDFKFIQADVLEIDIEPTDVLFIDTLHCYSQLLKELQIHSNKVKHNIILHDTTTFGYVDEVERETKKTGLRAAVEEFLLTNENWTITEVYENNNGLTILERVGKDDKGDRVILYSKQEIDICIVSYAKNEELKKVTNRCIETLINSEKNIVFNVFIVESNKDVNYDFMSSEYVKIKTIYTDLPFGYHRYLNLAIKMGNSRYVVLCNNDLTFEKCWASEIIRAMDIYPDILSASPFCPQIQKREDYKDYLAYYGRDVRKQLAGWCIFQQRKIYDFIGELDESFRFWFCDNDYSMELNKYNINHALISTSVVNHHEKDLGRTIILDENKDELTLEQRKIFMDKWNQNMTLT